MSSGWTTAAVLEYLGTVVAGITGVQQVVIGVPETLTTRATAYLTVGGHRFGELNRVQERWTRYLIVFGYRVRGMEATAETTVATWVDALQTAVLADLTLGGRVASLEIDASLAETPLYASFAGYESRLYPLVVECMQYQEF